MRASPLDLAFVGATTLTSAWTWDWPGGVGRALLLVVSAFFLFCNVVRLRRSHELAWAVGFLLVAAFFVARDGVDIAWSEVGLACGPWTVALVASGGRRREPEEHRHPSTTP
ncbi:MAG: hypothetical protein H6721_17140 [Sandaracinus sp.]|nr:hypothetical protein [Sandaracinus sp.]MCB9633846.1 hypothetical protein [Sandaracinus sp.]